MTELHNLRKLYFEEGKSITEISRETGRDRKMVRVYLEKEDWNDVRRGSMTEVEFLVRGPICSVTVAYFAPVGRPVCSGHPAVLLRNMQPELFGLIYGC